MSGGDGASVLLASKGPQDAYLLDSKQGDFPFKMNFARVRNFTRVPKKLPFLGQINNNGSCILQVPSLGDLVTGMWFEGTGLSTALQGSRFDLYIGGQPVDSQTFEYMSEIHQVYLRETQAKADTFNNLTSVTNDTFFPLHFFFCDNDMFLPLVSLNRHAVEIHISWGPNVSSAAPLKAFANYVFLDKEDREIFVNKPMDFLITQVQRIPVNNPVNIDLSVLNHPVRAIFFGNSLGAHGATTGGIPSPFTFESADIVINGKFLLEQMSPTYFYTAQVYYGTNNGTPAFDTSAGSPKYTQYFMYNFSLNATSYRSLGACNFSRLDNAKMNLSNPSGNTSGMTVYAVNYNILHIEKGMSGVLFSN